MRRLYIILILLIIQLDGYAATRPETAKTESPNILVLVSYHKGMSWADSIVAGIETTLKETLPGCELFIEYMDTKRNTPEETFPALAELYAQKYRNRQFDSIIACDDSALDFLLAYRDRLFPQVPVVFCGVNFYDRQKLSQLGNSTGVIEYLELRGTIETALKLHPQTRNMFIINDRTATANANRKLLEKMEPVFEKKVKIEYLTDYSIKELLEKVKKIPDDSVILLLTFNHDRLGQNISYEQCIDQLHAVSPVPIYGVWGFYLPRGILGGAITDGEQQGIAAARLTLNIMQGTPADKMPVITKIDTPYKFDYREMQRFHLTAGQLPPDSIIINQPYSFFREHRVIMLSGIFIILAEGILILLLINNIIRRKQLEHELRSSQENLRITMHSIADAVITADTKGMITNMNYAAEQLTGWKIVEAFQQPLEKIVPLKRGNTNAIVSFPLEQVINTGISITQEEDLILTARNGSEHQFAGSSAPLIGINDEIIGVVIIARDVTYEYELEKQLRQSQKMDALGKLTSGIAHDFGNILQIILGYGEILEKKSTDEKNRTLCHEIITAGISGKNMVSQLLAFSNNDLPKQRTLVDLNDTVNQTRIILGRILGDNITVQLRLSENPLKTVINTAQMEQVLINLCLNARDAMPKGGKVTISTYLFFCHDKNLPSLLDPEPGAYACCEVADTGTGIPPEIQDRIFDPFFTTKTEEKRSGLGLSASYGIIKKHGGTIDVNSEPGHGTVMRIYLPIAKAEEEMFEQFVETREFLNAKDGETVFLVEDDPKVRELGRNILESAQYKIVEAVDGEHAMEVFDRESANIALVLLDVILPRKSGIELAEYIHSKKPDMPLLYCSGYSEELINHPEITGHLLIKPYQRNELLNRIKEELVNAQNRKNGRGTRHPSANP